MYLAGFPDRPPVQGYEYMGYKTGSLHAAVAKAVMDAVEEGVIPKEKADDLFIIVSVFIEWDAEDKKKIYDYNYEATKLAIKRAFKKEPNVDEVLEKKDQAKHPFA